MGRNLQAFKGCLNLLLDRFNTHLVIQHIEQVLRSDVAIVFQSFLCQCLVDVFCQVRVFLHEVVHILEVAEAAIAHRYDIDVVLFSQCKIPGR